MLANRIVPLEARQGLPGSCWLLRFRHREIARGSRAGQFVMIKAGTSASPPLRRPFSIMATNTDEESFTLFVKDVGPVSHALCTLEIGDLAQCLGPLGRPFSAPPAGTEALLVAGGYGIAPLCLLAEELRRSNARGRLFYGGRTLDDLSLLGHLERTGTPVVPATEDGTLGFHGRVTEPVEEWLDTAGDRAVRLYACGPQAMMRAVARMAERRGLAAEVSLDPWMGCGMGTCLGCVVRVQDGHEARARYRCACTEGPVFDSARIRWPGEDVSRARREVTGVET